MQDIRQAIKRKSSNKAAEAIVEMLNEKGITITDLELKMLIEATVSKFNEAFRKDYGFDDVTEEVTK